MGAEQSSAGGGCCANRDHEAPRAPPRFYQLLTEPKRTVRRKSRKEASHKRIIAEIGYRKYQLGLVFSAYDVGGKGHLDLDELRTLAANMEGTDGQSKLMHATKEVKAMMRILNDGAGLTVSEGGFKTNMYTCLNVKVVQDRYFDQIMVKLRMSADSMMAAPDSDDSDGDDGDDDDERRGRGGGGGAGGAEVPESTEEGKGGSSNGGRGGEAGSSSSSSTVMPHHIAHLRHQLKDVFEKYDMRDKDGKQDGKLLHEEFAHFAAVWDVGDAAGIAELRARINKDRNDLLEASEYTAGLSRPKDVRLTDFVEFWYNELQGDSAEGVMDALQRMHEKANERF